ncbi:hypothetical protein WMF28_15310 [Sorangium sp. So ce590]|uniref:hypothetical protein n=1 Tax=Sorangium sp. So ce590 TaxID=3133317 RepID=UPI003F6052B1
MAGGRKKGAEESLTAALARLLEKTLLPDLLARAQVPALAAGLAEQHAREVHARRTATPLAEWTTRWLEQIMAQSSAAGRQSPQLREVHRWPRRPPAPEHGRFLPSPRTPLESPRKP